MDSVQTLLPLTIALILLECGTHGGQRESVLSVYHMRPRIELRLSGLAVSTFNHGVISPDTVLSKPDFQVLPSPTC